MQWADIARHPMATLAHLTLILLCTISAALGVGFIGLGILADIAAQNTGFFLLSTVLSLSMISMAIAWATFQNLRAVVLI
jgi:hypothetical protein